MERVILELPEIVADRARTVSQRDGRTMEEVLVRWLEQNAAADEVLTLMPDVEYPVYTPFGNEEAAQVMLDYLNAEKARRALSGDK